MQASLLKDDLSILSGLRSVVSGYLGALSAQCSREVKEKVSQIIPELAECEKLMKGHLQIEGVHE